MTHAGIWGKSFPGRGNRRAKAQRQACACLPPKTAMSSVWSQWREQGALSAPFTEFFKKDLFMYLRESARELRLWAEGESESRAGSLLNTEPCVAGGGEAPDGWRLCSSSRPPDQDLRGIKSPRLNRATQGPPLTEFSGDGELSG